VAGDGNALSGLTVQAEEVRQRGVDLSWVDGTAGLGPHLGHGSSESNGQQR